jgi:aldehyde:ferredoxin oxidoreductase
MYGWMGKILRVNLGTEAVTEISTEPYAERFLGGRGIASRIYWETVKPHVGAFDSENRLIFATGPLVGTGAQGATRMSLIGKSPMTLPEGFCYGNMGGFVGAELKKAGFDGLVIEGKAKRPVYVRISDNKAEICDASSLWGKKVSEVAQSLRGVYGEKVRFITTGVAGERMVRTAVAVADHESTATGGWGAVMGSKNLKAIAINGSQAPQVAEPNKLKELNSYTVEIAKRFRLAIPPMLMGRKDLGLEVIGKGQCHQCGLECIRGKYRISTGQEGYRKCQSMEVYLPFAYGRPEEPPETLFNAPVLCNEYSICTFEVRTIVDWLYACYRSGSLGEEETGLPLSKIGSMEFFEALLHAIAYREGFGDILAEGLARGKDRLPSAAAKMIPHDVIPILRGELDPPRAFFAHALIYAMEPRVHMPLLHEVAFLRANWKIGRMVPGATPVTWEVFRNVAKTFWGSEGAANLISFDGKALATKKIQDRTYIKDSLGLCDFAWPIMYSKTTEDHVGDPTLEGKIFTAVTGEPADKLETYGERVFTLQRAIMVREGLSKGIESDVPPERNFTEPFTVDSLGRELTVPGPSGDEVTTKGNKLDWDQFKAMREEYYHLRGWNPETGFSLPETLARLQLSDLATVFPGKG